MLNQQRNFRIMGRKHFSVMERDILMNLIMEYKDIVESKKYDAAARAAKVRSWQNIADKFNSNKYITKRPWKILRKAWENIKARQKKAMVEKSGQVIGTERGSFLSCERLQSSCKFDIAIEDVSSNNWKQESPDILCEFVDHSSEAQVKVSPTVRKRLFVENKLSDKEHITEDESGSTTVEGDTETKVKEVSQSLDYEVLLHEKRMQAAELDIKIKEAQLRHQEKMYALKLKHMEEKTKRLKEIHEISILHHQLQHELVVENLQKSGGIQVEPVFIK